MRRLLTSFLVSLFLVSCAATAFAQQTHRCTDLPPVAWDSAPSATIRIVVDIRLPRVTSAKELYLNAMCGAQPAAVWDLVLRGEGGILDIPRPLADALNEAVPYMPRVDYMYVRGGGANREVVVILFANGYEGPFFELDVSGDDNPWTSEMVTNAATVWNGIPYDVMRRASHWLHDVALFDEHYTVHLRALQGLIDIQLFQSQKSRGLASFLGTLYAAKTNTDDALSFWAHEIGHYVDYEMNGVRGFAYTPEGSFQAISRENNTILGVPVPLWFRLKHDEAREWLDERGGCLDPASTREIPWGFATHYGLCGEMSGEDFADSLMLAFGITHEIQASDYDDTPWSLIEELSPGARHVDRPWSAYDHWFFEPSRLYDRTGDSDAPVMGAKVDYIHEHLAIHATLPQDADGDGVTWRTGQAVGDCSDVNPVDGECDAAGCSSNDECDDGDPCTVDRCREGQCTRTIRDSDGDGSPDSSCGGPDCDDADPAVAVGTTRSCTGACNLQGEQQCVAGGWTECSAPTTCECDPDAPPEVIPCGNCGTKQRHCRPDGTWAPPTACEPIDPTADGCTPGTTRITRDQCGARMCDGRSIPRDRELTCNAQCSWEETRVCTLTEPTSAEVCNGADDDCDLDTDEGCIDELAFVSQAPADLIMGTYPYGDGSPNAGDCPHGYALAGFRLTQAHYSDVLGASYDILGSVRPICRELVLTTSMSGGAYEYEISTGAATELPTQGKYHQFHANWECPSGQVVRGIEVKRGWFIDRIKVHCSALAVTGSIGSYQLERQSGTTSPTLVSGSDLNVAQYCDGDGVATGLRTRTGDAVDGIGLNCSNVSLTIR